MSDGKQRGPFICQHCGVTYFTTRRKGEGEKFCSRHCSDRANSIAKTKPKIPKPPSVCPYCAKQHAGILKKQYCSDDCRKAMARRRALIYGKTKKDYSARTCKHCNTSFIPSYGMKYRTFCGSKCAKKYEKRLQGGTHRQRAKKRGVKCERFDPIYVLIRDHWTCQLCGCKTPKALRGSREPNAPELDHIIPLSRGGSHTKTNTQCACRRCNSNKGAIALGQLHIAL